MSFLSNIFTKNTTQKNMKAPTNYATKVAERVEQKKYTRRNDRDEEVRKKRLKKLDTPSPQQNEMDLSPQENEMDLSHQENEIDQSSPQENEMDSSSPQENEMDPSSPQENEMDLSHQENKIDQSSPQDYKNEDVRKKRLKYLDTPSPQQNEIGSSSPQENEMDYYSSKDNWNIDNICEEIKAHISQYQTETEEQKYLMNNYAMMHYAEQQFAQTVLITQKCIQAYKECEKYEDRVFSILEQCVEYFSTIMKDHFNAEILKQPPSEKDQLLNTPQYVFNTPSGGHTNENENNKITNSLNYEVPDSQHDFKPSSMRNSFFPGIIKNRKINTESGLLVYNAIQDVLRNSTDANDLNKYILKSPISFEEDIKVDYLLGELAGNLEDIYYYFSDIGTVPAGWAERRKLFFGFTKIGTPTDQGEQTLIEPPRSIMKMVHDTKEQGYTNWILDACVSGRVSSQLGNRRYSLCNIWDPAKSAVTELIEDKLCNKDASLYDGQSYLGEACSLRPVSIPSTVVVDVDDYPNKTDYGIYDWVNDQTGESYYDMVYDPLLNNDNLAKYEIYIKLRIFKGTQTNPKIPNTRVAICVYKGSELRNISVIKSGFSVKELSFELFFIERSYKSKSLLKFNLLFRNDKLKKLMESIVVLTKESKPDISNEEIYMLLCTLVLRFKSSGDHGTSNTVNLINTRFKLNCMFLSGDNLAYVYAIASNINYTMTDANNATITTIGKTPTGARYYAAKATTGADENDDDNEDDIGGPEEKIITGNHFMVMYLPSGDDDAKYTAKLQRVIECIFQIMSYSQYTPQEVTTITPDTLMLLQERIQMTSGYLISEINKIQLDKANEVESTKTTDALFAEASRGLIEQNIPAVTLQSSVVDLFIYIQKNPTSIFADLSQKKAFITILIHFCNTITFLSKFAKIQELSYKMIESDIQALTPIMDLSPETAATSQRSRRGISTKLSQLSLQIQTNIRNVLTSSKNANITVENVNKIAKTIDVNAKTTAYDLITNIKSTFIKNSKELTKQMELLGFTPEFIKSRLSSGLLERLINTIKAEIKKNGGDIGPALAEEFGNTLLKEFGNVVADLETSELNKAMQEKAVPASVASPENVAVPENVVSSENVAGPVEQSSNDAMEVVNVESKPSIVNVTLNTKIIAKNIENYVFGGVTTRNRGRNIFGNMPVRSVVQRTGGGKKYPKKRNMYSKKQDKSKNGKNNHTKKRHHSKTRTNTKRPRKNNATNRRR